jgi:hypothetical protein
MGAEMIARMTAVMSSSMIVKPDSPAHSSLGILLRSFSASFPRDDRTP